MSIKKTETTMKNNKTNTTWFLVTSAKIKAARTIYKIEILERTIDNLCFGPMVSLMKKAASSLVIN